MTTVVGIILFGSGWTIFFLTFTLASSAENKWHCAAVIAMIVVGFTLLITLVIYEVFF
jgi:hypothetical protein